MSRRRRYLPLIAGVLAVGLLVWALVPSREPTYQGRKLSDWLEVCAQHKRPGDRDKAMAAVRQIGPQAVPFLVKWIRHEPPRWTSRLRRENRGRTLVAAWETLDRRRPRADAAVAGFHALGSEAKAAVPELVQLMNDTSLPASARRATQSLALLGETALPPMLEALTNSTLEIRSYIAACIVDCGTNGLPAIPALIQCLDDEDKRVAETAAMTLGWFQLQPDLVVPALAKCIWQSSDRTIRVQALLALGRFGEKARTAVPTLVHALQDPDRDVQRWVAKALYLIDPQALNQATNALRGFELQPRENAPHR